MFLENIKEAITSIFSNKMRSVLTMLGIIIGISAVITITTIGNSIQTTLTSTLNSLGGNTVQAYVDARYPEDDADWDTWEYPEMKTSDFVTQEMIDELVEKYPDEFDGIAASEFLGNGQIRQDKNTYANVSVQGTTSEYIDYMKLKMYAGRNLTKQDNKTKKNVCIVADTMAKQYFGDENPIGEQITYADSDGNLYNFTIVGIYEYNAALFGKVDTSVPEKDRYTTMFIPIQTCFKLMGKDQSGYTNFNLMVNSLADIDQATTDVTNFFEEKYANNKNFHVTTYNMASDMGMITIAVSGIALISLIVGGVGVMNIMLVSITERTREIGVRMALGAKRSTIRMQFVIEAIVLCIFGGMIGILIGVFNGFVLGKAAEFVIQNMYSEYSSYIIMSVRPSLSAIVLSLFFSMLTGVFFGYYPANKAAKMEVIDALRYE
ncbi:MAG: ABC transporter permease [Roseburia sp.]|nr:ABC transporter permease [Roseburia sp.]